MTSSNVSTELGRLLAQTNRNVHEIKEFGFGNQLSGFYQMNPYDSILLVPDRLLLTKQLIGSAFILSHPVNGELGSSSFSLGSGGLGDSSDIWVSHSDKTYIERFGSDIMTNTDLSTISLTHSQYKLQFTSTYAEWYSKRIFYDASGNQTYDSIVATAVGDSTGNLVYSATLDGSNWETIKLGKTYKWSTPGSDIRAKISNDQGKYSWPMAWASWGGVDTAPAYLTEFKLIYGTGFGTNIIN